MRQVAIVRNTDDDIRRVMLHEAGDAGTYLYLYNSLDSKQGVGDYWFASVADATELAQRRYAIVADDWRDIRDPMPGEPDDLIPDTGEL
jgi:hypothetical protein